MADRLTNKALADRLTDEALAELERLERLLGRALSALSAGAREYIRRGEEPSGDVFRCCDCRQETDVGEICHAGHCDLMKLIADLRAAGIEPSKFEPSK